MERRVVVTGIGIWSCLGSDIERVKDSLYEGRSGIGIEQERIEYGYQSALTGIVEKPVLKGLLTVGYVWVFLKKLNMPLWQPVKPLVMRESTRIS